jgi:nucleoside-diphosphate-sugar epimerase
MSVDFSKKRVVLVGGAGFIGHNLALALKKQGANVDVIDSLQVNNLVTVSSESDRTNRGLYLKMLHERLDLLHDNGIPLYIQDAREYHALSHLLTKINPDVVVQLAAVAHASKSNKDPYSTFDHSFRTLENVLDWCRGRKKHIVYFSSSMVYGNFEKDEVTEDDPLKPLGIYGTLKLSGEKLVEAYNRVFDLPYTIVRPSALYGPRCISRRVGQIFIEKALSGEKLVIDGEGDEKLDFTYINDLVQGISLVLANKKAINETFNLTAGQARPIADLKEIVKKHFPNIEIEYVERDRLRPRRGTLNIDKARRLIGYEPQYPLEKGFEKYINWYHSFIKKEGKLS